MNSSLPSRTTLTFTQKFIMMAIFVTTRCRSVQIGRRSLSNIQLIKQLREEVRAPLNLVKSAVSAAEPAGDYDAALAVLKLEMKKRGEKFLAKSGERTTSEGWVVAARSNDGRSAALFVLNCETDFVSKSDKIVDLAVSVGQDMASASSETQKQARTDHAILSQDQIDGLISKKTPVKQRIMEAISLFGENIKLSRAYTSQVSNTNAIVGVHCHGGPSISKNVYLGRMGAMISLLSKAKAMPEARANELAREIVAQNPDTVDEFWNLEKIGDEQGRTVRQWAGEDVEIMAWTRLER